MQLSRRMCEARPWKSRAVTALPPTFSPVSSFSHVVPPLQALLGPATTTREHAPLATLCFAARRRPCISSQFISPSLQAIARQRVHECTERRTVGLSDHTVVSYWLLSGSRNAETDDAALDSPCRSSRSWLHCSRMPFHLTRVHSSCCCAFPKLGADLNDPPVQDWIASRPPSQ